MTLIDLHSAHFPFDLLSLKPWASLGLFPVLMAFRLDYPDPGPKPKVPARTVIRWILIAVPGIALGVSCFFLMVSTGAVERIVGGLELSRRSQQTVSAAARQEAADSGPSEPLSGEGPPVPVTGCEEPLGPEEGLRGFFRRISDGDMQAAWRTLAPGLKARLYADDYDAFEAYWSIQGPIEVGLVTTMQPSESSAVVLAQLLYTDGAVQAEFEAEMYYDRQQCLWMIGSAVETRSDDS